MKQKYLIIEIQVSSTENLQKEMIYVGRRIRSLDGVPKVFFSQKATSLSSNEIIYFLTIAFDNKLATMWNIHKLLKQHLRRSYAIHVIGEQYLHDKESNY